MLRFVCSILLASYFVFDQEKKAAQRLLIRFQKDQKQDRVEEVVALPQNAQSRFNDNYGAGAIGHALRQDCFIRIDMKQSFRWKHLIGENGHCDFDEVDEIKLENNIGECAHYPRDPQKEKGHGERCFAGVVVSIG